MAGPAIDDLIKSGKVAPGSRVDLARSGVGVAVRAGAPKPDIHSTEALKKTLLAAKSIGYSTGPSGVYLAGLFRRLGIADQIQSKLKQTPTGVFVGGIIASGEVEIGFQQVSELAHYPGHRLRGPATGRHPERDGLLERDADWGEVGRCRQGMDHVPDIPGGGGGVQEQEHGACRRPTPGVDVAGGRGQEGFRIENYSALVANWLSTGSAMDGELHRASHSSNPVRAADPPV